MFIIAPWPRVFNSSLILFSYCHVLFPHDTVDLPLISEAQCWFSLHIIFCISFHNFLTSLIVWNGPKQSKQILTLQQSQVITCARCLYVLSPEAHRWRLQDGSFAAGRTGQWKNLLLKRHFKAPSSAKVSSLTKLALLVLLLLLAIDDDLVFGVDSLAYSPESRLRLLPSVLVGWREGFSQCNATNLRNWKWVRIFSISASMVHWSGDW